VEQQFSIENFVNTVKDLPIGKSDLDFRCAADMTTKGAE
jgi:hypothetical protein